MKVISSEHVVYAFKETMEAIESVSNEETFEIETKDCFSDQIISESQTVDEIDFSKINPATGPIYVEEAEAGDTLKIEILDIQLPSFGVMIIAPGEGVLGESVKKSKTRIVKIENNTCILGNVAVPAHPMIGVIGVAPKNGSYPTGTPWKHGGNMDTIDITKGATLYLPINQKGALLALGDCHAAMGDGEVCVTGCEISSKVKLKVSVVKEFKLEWPWVVNDDSIAVITSGDTIEEAIKEATRCAVKRLVEANKMGWEDAYMLTSLAVDIKVSQVVDPKKTVRASIPKNILNWDF